MLHNAKNIFIVIPAYNEQKVIASVVQTLVPNGYSMVVVDDGSANSLQPLLKNLPVYFLRHCINLGQGAALQTGIDFAIKKNAAYIITFDADGQHQAEDVQKLVHQLSAIKLDVVIGSRFLPGSLHNMAGKRKLVLRLARYVNFIFTGLFLTDAHNGLRGFTREAAKKIKLKENGMAHATEIIFQVKKQRLKYAEVPVHVQYTRYSEQKGQSLWNGFRIFFDLLLNKIFQ